MSDDTTVKNDLSIVLDVQALIQRLRDLELYPAMDFRAEFLAITDDMRSAGSALASQNPELASELESIAEDMAQCGTAACFLIDLVTAHGSAPSAAELP